MQRYFARNFLLTDQTRNWLTNFGRYSRAKKLLRRKVLSEIFCLLGFELSVKKVACGKFFSAVCESEHRPAKNNPQSGANPATPAREEIVGLLARFFYAKNAALFRPQFPSYRPNAKLLNQFRSVLSCEEIATKKGFVGNILHIRIWTKRKKSCQWQLFLNA